MVQPFFQSLVIAPRNVHCPAATLQAKASVQKDADAIKKHIKEKHQSFEYVNRTVEHALWCEVIEYLERSESAQPSHESTSTGPATTLTESDVSMEKSEMPSEPTLESAFFSEISIVLQDAVLTGSVLMIFTFWESSMPTENAPFVDWL